MNTKKENNSFYLISLAMISIFHVQLHVRFSWARITEAHNTRLLYTRMKLQNKYWDWRLQKTLRLRRGIAKAPVISLSKDTKNYPHYLKRSEAKQQTHGAKLQRHEWGNNITEKSIRHAPNICCWRFTQQTSSVIWTCLTAYKTPMACMKCFLWHLANITFTLQKFKFSCLREIDTLPCPV